MVRCGCWCRHHRSSNCSSAHFASTTAEDSIFLTLLDTCLKSTALGVWHFSHTPDSALYTRRGRGGSIPFHQNALNRQGIDGRPRVASEGGPCIAV